MRAFLGEIMTLNDHELELVFKGKGKSSGKGKRTTGKGKGRRGNPIGPDGQRMRCRVPNCGSEEHFERDCPLRAQSGQQASGSGVFQASGGGLVVQSHYALEGPLTGVSPAFMITEGSSMPESFAGGLAAASTQSAPADGLAAIGNTYAPNLAKAASPWGSGGDP